jgi:dephospho-CoA kinase
MTTGKKPVLGLIGGIGSGKSLVAELLAKHGAKIISGDRIGHQALRDPKIKARIIARFGEKILDAHGDIDRRSLGKIVFGDACERKALENIVHPWIEERAREEIERAQSDAAAAFTVLDAAIMLEAGWAGPCDYLIFVDADRVLRLERVAKQRGWTASDVEMRERAQMPLEEKKKQSDFTIDNSGPPQHVEEQLEHLLRRLGLSSPSEQAGATCEPEQRTRKS